MASNDQKRDSQWPPRPLAQQPDVTETVQHKGDPQAVYVGAFAFVMALLTLAPYAAPQAFGFLIVYTFMTGWPGFIGGCLAFKSLWGRLAFYISIANFILFLVGLSQFHVN